MVFFCLANFTSLDLAPAVRGPASVRDSSARARQHKQPEVLLLSAVIAVSLWLLASTSLAHADGHATDLRLQRCFDEIAHATKSYSDGRADIASERLQQLTHSCSGVAHLYHNLGAIAALRRDWDQAIIYLEQSLAIDRRAAMTQAGLSGIYQYKAALAYRKALELSGPLPKPPAIMLQNGELGNGPVAPAAGTTTIEPVTGITNVPPAQLLQANAVRFEVAQWWMARREKAPELPPWSAVNYSPDTLDQNLALVFLGFEEQQLLLVLRKSANRWNIIREKQL